MSIKTVTVLSDFECHSNSFSIRSVCIPTLLIFNNDHLDNSIQVSKGSFEGMVKLEFVGL